MKAIFASPRDALLGSKKPKQNTPRTNAAQVKQSDPTSTIAKVLQNPNSMKELKEAFKFFDEDKSGMLDLEELKKFVRATLHYYEDQAYISGQKDLLVQLVRKEKTAKDEEAYDAYCAQIFNDIDSNKDGSISFEEFQNYLLKSEGERLMILGIEKDLLSQMGLIEREPNAEEVIAAALLEPELSEFVLTGLSLTELPADITKLGDKVKTLELGFNSFETWPAQLNTFQNLSQLSLTANSLTDFEADLSGLANLTDLEMIGNKMVSISDNISQLKSLVKLNLSNNCLTSISPQISTLQNLEELNLSGNNLATLPIELGKCVNVNMLDLNGNMLTSFPSEIMSMVRMMELDLGNNKLDKLPENINQLKWLVYLNICDNQITTLPIALGGCTMLSRVLFDRNPIKDEEALRKYNMSMDHFKDCLEKRWFLHCQEMKQQKKMEESEKLNKGSAVAKSVQAKREQAKKEKEEKDAEAKSVPEATVNKKETPREPDEQMAEVNSLKQKLFSLKSEVNVIKKRLFPSTEMIEIVTVAKAMKNALQFLEAVRHLVPCKKPNPPNINPHDEQVIRLKNTTIYSIQDFESFTQAASSLLQSSSFSKEIINPLLLFAQGTQKIFQGCTVDLSALTV